MEYLACTEPLRHAGLSVAVDSLVLACVILHAVYLLPAIFTISC